MLAERRDGGGRPPRRQRRASRPRSTACSTHHLADPGDGRDRLFAAMRHAGDRRRQAAAPVAHRRRRRACSGSTRSARIRAGAAIEAIHVYSLIHDDLPCMDDDDLRRGKPTVHKAFDEATAVLAGDCFHDLAFEILSDVATHEDPVRPRRAGARTGRAPRGRTAWPAGRCSTSPPRARRSTSARSAGCSSSRPAR